MGGLLLYEALIRKEFNGLNQKRHSVTCIPEDQEDVCFNITN